MVAMAMDVPIHGNTEKIQAEIEKLQEDIIQNGITIIKDGKKNKLTISKYANLNFEKDQKILNKLGQIEKIYPVDIRLESVGLNLPTIVG